MKYYRSTDNFLYIICNEVSFLYKFSCIFRKIVFITESKIVFLSKVIEQVK